MNQKLIEFNRALRRTDIPSLRTGDVVRITRKIKEGAKERTQVFEGMIIALKGGQSSSKTITVRKVSLGIGVELVLPLNSPQVQKIELVKHTKAGRAKIYYVRTKSVKVLSRKLKEVPMKKSEKPQIEAKKVEKSEPVIEVASTEKVESTAATTEKKVKKVKK